MNKFLLRRLGVADDPGGFKPSLHDCLEAVLTQSDALVEDMLAGLQASLAPARGKSQATQHSPATRAAIQILTTQPSALKQLFGKALRAAVYGGDTQRASAAVQVRFDDFQFLEEEQIDANIEMALTQQEVQMAVDDVLPALNALVSSLMGFVTVQAHLSPLKPESFVYALRESLSELIPEDAVRAALMTPVAGMLGNSLRQLYKEVGEWLRSQGVEPVAPHSSSVGGFGAPIKAPENAVSRTMLTLDKLRRLLSGELDPGPLAAGAKDFMHTVPASYVALEDMKLVEPMMKRLAARANQAVSNTTGEKLAGPTTLVRGDTPAQRQHAQSKKLGRQLGEEVVRLMLENLMQDHRLLPPVRAGLHALEPVLIKLSQTDARFFSERQHPARQFLDKLTSRSLAFSSPEEPGFPRFQKTLENAVNVLAWGESDAAAFARVLRKLEEGWSKDEQEQRIRAEEAARGLMHAEQRNLLAERMAHDFNERLQKKKVPEMVANFLRGPWAQVVAESQLLRTDGGADADGYLALVEDLIWSVQLKLARRNRARLVAMVPGMLVTMRQGLGLISYPEERIAVLFDELITFHEQAFEAGRPVPADATVAPATEVPAEEQTGLSRDAFWIAQDEAADSGYLRGDEEAALDFTQMPEPPEVAQPQDWSTESLTTGSWVDLALGGVWVRAQLTWASPHRTLFMFISGAGMAHSMSRRTMNRLHGLGLIRLVSDGRVMDNALDAVAQAALRNDVEKAGGV
ncbi:DUF1631 family protein [Rhodoferax saidenbachensis]|uniref:Thymidine phosphorylase n=1 Tax=Rhodoferax saidenbachensis TaxID=1484693 RepID=A0A1P8K7V7_9BURK|nr:DUF1631 family protein [Rhodoferax saidenbachensis]APW42100.1 hypothetical protein RS694_05845 [Rhodoferax saidenbachensis]